VSLVIRNNGDWVKGGSGGRIQIWRGGKPLGNYFQSGFGSIWSLIERRDGELMSANGDGTIYIYPTPARAIRNACQQLNAYQFMSKINNPAYGAASNLCASQSRDFKPSIPSRWLSLFKISFLAMN
jgi:hypothetical protein